MIRVVSTMKTRNGRSHVFPLLCTIEYILCIKNNWDLRLLDQACRIKNKNSVWVACMKARYVKGWDTNVIGHEVRDSVFSVAFWVNMRKLYNFFRSLALTNWYVGKSANLYNFKNVNMSRYFDSIRSKMNQGHICSSIALIAYSYGRLLTENRRCKLLFFGLYENW